jgi:hypothetical protein
MDLSAAEVGYFIEQVAMSAASFGVAQDDLTIVRKAINGLFNVGCAPPTAIIPSLPAELQSICTDDTCALSPNATCSSYDATMEPAAANSTMSGNGTSSMGSMGSSSIATGGASKTSAVSTPTGSTPSTISQAAAATFGMSFVAAAGGLFAAFL